MSTEAIKQAALYYRDKHRYCINAEGAVDVVRILETTYKDSFYIIPDEEMPDAYAITTPSGDILLSNNVYELACQDDPRSRFTIAHEFGHLILHIPLDGFGEGKDAKNYKEKYFDSEWQADTFAAELLIPTPILEALINTTPIEIISKKFMVSRQCLETKIYKLKKFKAQKYGNTYGLHYS